MIHVKRVYAKSTPGAGQKFLIDRLWPRGIKRTDLQCDAWFKDVAPSTELRNWYHREPDKWEEFRNRYFAELDAKPESWRPLLEAAAKGTITLLYSSRETEHNNATALKEYLERKLSK